MTSQSAPPADVMIAGLGAMGSAAAWQLAVRGRRVVGFDRFHPPHAMGSSTGRSRIIREAYWESPFYVPLVRRAYELWAALEQRSGRPLLRPTGGLVIGPGDGSLVSGAIASAREHGVAFEHLGPRDIASRFPAFQPGDHLEGVFEPRAGVLMPEDAIGAMLGEAAKSGADLRFDEPVERWVRQGDLLVVHTSHGVYTTRCLILAAGAWMASALPGTPLPLQVVRQTMFWLRPSGGLAAALPSQLPIWLWETGEGPVYYGFPDLGDGPKVARHHDGERCDPGTVRREVADDESEEITRFLADSIPALAGPVTDARVCLYTNTPDEHFILDRHPDDAAVLIASPCSGHGFKFAPTIGELLADLAMDRAPRFDVTPFRLNRFGADGLPAQ